MFGSGDYYEALIKQKYPDLQYDFMYFNECSDYVLSLLHFYPSFSSKHRLSGMLDSWLSSSPEHRMAIVEDAMKMFRKQAAKNADFKNAPPLVWSDYQGFLKTMTIENPKRVRDVVFSTFRVAEAAEGDECRRTPLRMDGGGVTKVPYTGEQKDIYDYLHDVMKLPAVSQTLVPGFTAAVAVAILTIPEAIFKDENFQRQMTECSCGNKNATKLCGRCKTKKYCSIQCQKNDWKEHKQGCKDGHYEFEFESRIPQAPDMPGDMAEMLNTYLNNGGDLADLLGKSGAKPQAPKSGGETVSKNKKKKKKSGKK